MGMLGELETTLDSVNKDLESSTATIEEKEGKLIQTELNKRTLISKEEKVSLMCTLTELETTLDSLKKDLESSKATTEQNEGKLVDLRCFESLGLMRKMYTNRIP